MTTHRPSAGRLVVLAIASLALIGFASCSSDDSDDSSDDTTTTEATSESSAPDTGGSGESAATKRFDEQVQQELEDLGCYTGSVDGIIGPETDAAILAFQTASGITADGELGPETEAALTAAVEAGTAVCDGSTSSTTTEAGSTTTAPSGGGAAPCTGTAITAALPSGSTVASYICSEGYAAGKLSSGDTFILESADGAWSEMAESPCGTASAGLPPEILEEGCA